MKQIVLSKAELSDLELLAIGGYAPLAGFLGEDDYHSVVETMRLTNGAVWSIPITLAVTEQQAKQLSLGDEVELVYEQTVYGTMEVQHIYRPDKRKEALLVYQTEDLAHPGVKKII